MDNVINAVQLFSRRRLDADVARINNEPMAQAAVDRFVDALFAEHDWKQYETNSQG